jgi:hypothetical protein
MDVLRMTDTYQYLSVTLPTAMRTRLDHLTTSRWQHEWIGIGDRYSGGHNFINIQLIPI